jgi:hypothetical protein
MQHWSWPSPEFHNNASAPISCHRHALIWDALVYFACIRRWLMLLTRYGTKTYSLGPAYLCSSMLTVASLVNLCHFKLLVLLFSSVFFAAAVIRDSTTMS